MIAAPVCARNQHPVAGRLQLGFSTGIMRQRVGYQRSQWGLCWFSRNATLFTRSGPEGSSQGRRRVCRDVAGRAPTHLWPHKILQLHLSLKALLHNKTTPVSCNIYFIALKYYCHKPVIIDCHFIIGRLFCSITQKNIYLDNIVKFVY